MDSTQLLNFPWNEHIALYGRPKGTKLWTHNTNLSHTSRNVTDKQVELSSWGVRQISMLIYWGKLKNLHTFPHFIYGGKMECCDIPRLSTSTLFPRFIYKALFWLTCLAWIRILYIAYNSMEEDNLHVTEDIIQSLVRGIVGELFVPDNWPRQDQQFGATEDDHEINNRFC
jgi:hypothetical protein